MDSSPECERPTSKNPNGRTGTVPGYKAHRRIDEKACDPCRIAWGKFTRNQQANISPETRARRKLLSGRFARHNISEEYFDLLFAAQGNRCAICHVTETSLEWRIDHDHSCCSGSHSCGKCVRGVLCSNCNAGIGFLKDNTDNLTRAIAYLTR